MSNEPMEHAGRAGAGRASLMARLRAETREGHTATERTRLARAIYDGGVDRAQYAHVLRFLRVVNEHLERAIATSPEARVRAIGATVDSKLPWLDRDLAALGEPTRAPTDAERDATSALLAFIDDAARDLELLAVFYVFEGSTTGGQFLATRLEGNPRIPGDALHFYRGNGAETVARFREFGARVDAAVTEEVDQARLVARARAAFDAIRACFEATGSALLSS